VYNNCSGEYAPLVDPGDTGIAMHEDLASVLVGCNDNFRESYMENNVLQELSKDGKPLEAGLSEG